MKHGMMTCNIVRREHLTLSKLLEKLRLELQEVHEGLDVITTFVLIRNANVYNSEYNPDIKNTIRISVPTMDTTEILHAA